MEKEKDELPWIWQEVFFKPWFITILGLVLVFIFWQINPYPDILTTLMTLIENQIFEKVFLGIISEPFFALFFLFALGSVFWIGMKMESKKKNEIVRKKKKNENQAWPVFGVFIVLAFIRLMTPGKKMRYFYLFLLLVPVPYPIDPSVSLGNAPFLPSPNGPIILPFSNLLIYIIDFTIAHGIIGFTALLLVCLTVNFFIVLIPNLGRKDKIFEEIEKKAMDSWPQPPP